MKSDSNYFFIYAKKFSVCLTLSEKLYEESLAVAKMKSDSNYFFIYAKKFSVCLSDIGPLYDKKRKLLTNWRCVQFSFCLNDLIVISNIIPILLWLIHKKGSDAENFQPISLTSIPAYKLLEEPIKDQVIIYTSFKK